MQVIRAPKFSLPPLRVFAHGWDAGPALSFGMKIVVQTVGRFKEVAFYDFENPDVRAQSGLLDAVEARDLSLQLREVADRLHEIEEVDYNQTLLPFIAPEPRGRFAVNE